MPDTAEMPYSAEHYELAQNFLDHHGVLACAADAALAQLFVEIEQKAIGRFGVGGNNPPPIPEKLVDVDALPAMMDANYRPLIKRAAELQNDVDRWIKDHLVPPPAEWPAGKPWPVQYAIKGEADNDFTSDLWKHLAEYAGGKTDTSGEVYEARTKITKPLRAAAEFVIKWTDNLRAPARNAMHLMDCAQKAYIQAKEEARRREAKRLADLAAEEARLAQQVAIDTAGDDEAVADAVQADARAAEAAKWADAPRTDMTRSTSALGTTTSARTNWVFEVTDIKALAKAVADGKIDGSFLTVNTQIINAHIKNKMAPLRECPGLRIYDDVSVGRSRR